MTELHDLTGLVSGRLTVVERGPDHVTVYGDRYVQWHCRCECGGEIDVLAHSLRHKRTKSCGCLRVSARAQQ